MQDVRSRGFRQGLVATCGHIARNIRRFAKQTSGNVALIYALALLPTFAAVGAAIDMGQAVVVRTRLSEALDAAGLAVGSTPGLSAAEIQQRAQQFFDANYPAEKLGTPATITAVQNGHVVQLSASANVTTAFMGLLGISELEVATTSEIVRENRGLEVVLSLDNTGSMANSGKIQALKTSMTELINILFGDSANPEKLKMGLVPFSETVRLDPQQAINNGWIDTTGAAPFARTHFNNNMHPLAVWATMKNSSWGGCVEARAGGHEELDTPPSVQNPATLWVPFFQPDEPDNGSYDQNYLNDGINSNNHTIRMQNSAKYVNRQSTRPNTDCSMQRVLGLTNSKSTLLSYVNGMQTSGYTHIAIGAAWGWRLLSPEEPFTEGSAFG
ncbi:MAG TPA: hypothetical protein DCL54_10555, partial [Alphaproteobacteria bacterium]|nr:hypothetical protein [Alphaproteobacteria bacterium]